MVLWKFLMWSRGLSMLSQNSIINTAGFVRVYGFTNSFSLCLCVGVSVIAADGLISASCRWSALLFKTCALCPCCQIVLVFPLCPGSVQFPVPVLRLLGFRFELRIPYVPGKYTAAAHLRPCAAKSDCDPAHASSDSGFMSYLDSHK